MDHQVQAVIIILVDFDEMVSAAESPDAVHEDQRGHLGTWLPVTAKVFAGNDPFSGFYFCRFMNIAACRHIFPDHGVKGRKVDLLLFQPDRQHAAANVDSDQSGDHLISDRHGRPDHTAGARMAVRHDPDLRAMAALLVQKVQDLRDRGAVYSVCKDLG